MDNKKVIVTGGSGQLAQSLLALSESYKNLDFLFLSRGDLDISDRKQVHEIFNKLKPDYIINTAAYTKVDLAETNPEKALAINAYALQNIGQEGKGARIIHLSSDYVYHSNTGIPLSEMAATEPKGVYAKSKLLGEQILKNSHSCYIILRTSWLYSENGHNFVKTILNLASNKDQLSIVDDQIGAPTYSRDLARTILQIVSGTETYKIFNKDWNQVYNYANTGQISWYTFAKQILQYAQLDIDLLPIKSYEYPTPAKRPPWSVMDTSKINQLPGVEIYDWKESLQQCLQRIIN